MAITNLKHLKYDNGRGKDHLLRLLNYIQNPKKTENRLLTWSNCGLSPQSQFEQMMETKKFFSKEDGRQAYHFVISFPPDENITNDTALAFGKDFCERFFKGDYEYVMAVHTDQAHKHIHLVFNSVRQTDGYKYHYKNGDWEKLIQPVTDKLCKEYGLKILEYDKAEPRKGSHYADHQKKKTGGITWREIIRHDIDHAVSVATDMTSYISEMERMGYRIGRRGNLKGYGDYLTYHAPDTDGKTSKKGIRDRSLGSGYSWGEIENRILSRMKQGNNTKEGKSEELTIMQYIRMPNHELSRYQVCAVNRLRRMNDYHFMDLQIREQGAVRRDLLSLEQLIEECKFVLENNICNLSDAEIFLHAIKEKLEKAEIESSEGREEEISELKKARKILRRVVRHYEETMAVTELKYVKMKPVTPNAPLTDKIPKKDRTPAEEKIQPVNQ